jgi:hypothetical protein
MFVMKTCQPIYNIHTKFHICSRSLAPEIQDILKELKTWPALDYINYYNNKWTQHVHRMDKIRLTHVIMKHQPRGNRNTIHPHRDFQGSFVEAGMFQVVKVLECVMVMKLKRKINVHANYWAMFLLSLLSHTKTDCDKIWRIYNL